MKYNKGFIGIGIIIAIVVALVVGGGAVYFATKTPTSPKNIGENNYQPQENQNGVSNTSAQNTDTNIPTTDLNNSKNTTISKTTNITCESNEVPLIQTGEHIAKQIKEDLDKDGVKELMVIYEKTVSGWEGMPMPSYRFTLFTCVSGKLVASYKVDSYSSNSFDFINYESGKAVFLGGYGGWYLLVKNGKEFEKLSPSDQRLQELQKVGVVYHDGYHTSAKVSNNKIEEILPGFASNDPLCCPSQPEVKIIYEFKNHNFIVTSANEWRGVTVNAREFKYPASWSCEYVNGNKPYQCENNIVNSHTYTFHLYPSSSKGINDSISFLTIDSSDNQCVNWLKTNTYQHEGCVSVDGGKNYAVYTNSNLQSVISGFSLFIETNKKIQ